MPPLSSPPERVRNHGSCQTQASLRAAARLSRSRTDDTTLGFIRGLPLQYETQVGERGMALSAGERQRIAIARAFLANPAVLVLDEPTAALDPVSERQVIAGYEAVMKGRTTILITHRLELARQADRIVVLDGARIVESGSPDDLHELQGSFAKLFARAGA
ncbi:MAG: ATP-binding cassette domain-containing protein [Acidobacteriia bacterium]|nr:ATP-binding cassette domain-containing protein [Terriglobia bacterium]